MIPKYTPRIALLNSEIDLIRSIVLMELPSSKVFVFGSRVLGTAKKYSDIDIAIDFETKIEIKKLAQIKEFIEQKTDYLIDLVDFNAVSDEFNSTIIQTAVEITKTPKY